LALELWAMLHVIWSAAPERANASLAVGEPPVIRVVLKGQFGMRRMRAMAHPRTGARRAIAMHVSGSFPSPSSSRSLYSESSSAGSHGPVPEGVRACSLRVFSPQPPTPIEQFRALRYVNA
jgi:hypothetical protein